MNQAGEPRLGKEERNTPACRIETSTHVVPCQHSTQIQLNHTYQPGLSQLWPVRLGHQYKPQRKLHPVGMGHRPEPPRTLPGQIGTSTRATTQPTPCQMKCCYCVAICLLPCVVQVPKCNNLQHNVHPGGINLHFISKL